MGKIRFQEKESNMDIEHTGGNRLIILLGFFCLVGAVIATIWYLRVRAYNFYYYYSPDGDSAVTRIEYTPLLAPHCTFFVYGKIEDAILPQSYIRPVYSGRDGGFVLIFNWQNNICTFYAPHGNYDTTNLPRNLRFQKIDEYSDEWKRLREDTVNNRFLTEYKY